MGKINSDMKKVLIFAQSRFNKNFKTIVTKSSKTNNCLGSLAMLSKS